MADFDIRAYLKDRQQLVNRALKDRMNALAPETRLHSAMTYAVTAGGKRLRPILCLAACVAVGGQNGDAMPAAVALELVHTYSLIHDDLPAMDDDELRRGKPTCHKAFDEATAVLAGDALLTLAFEILSDLHRSAAVAPATALDVSRRIARAAGHLGMIEGQMQDLAAENRQLAIEDLEDMHRRKTGALIDAAIQSGAVIGGAEDDRLRRLVRYGRSLGLAFQIVDDILNVEGDPGVMGKASGTDRLRGKTTYPSLIGLDQSKILAREQVELAVEELEPFGHQAAPLRALAQYILNRRR